MSKRGEKLRPEVLAILRRRSGSLSAYDVLGELCEANPKGAQPTICRVLAALTARGRVHRIESLNAFIACQCDRHQHASILSICHDYGTVEESVAPAPTAGRARNTASRATGPSLGASSPCPPAHGSYCAVRSGGSARSSGLLHRSPPTEGTGKTRLAFAKLAAIRSGCVFMGPRPMTRHSHKARHLIETAARFFGAIHFVAFVKLLN